MVRVKLLRAAATTLTSLGLVVGFGGGVVGASSGSISKTGPDSNNKVISSSRNNARVWNNNHVNLGNVTAQHADSGSASAWHNTTAGDVTSGDASNATSLSANVSVDNSGSGAGDSAANAASNSSNNTGTVSDTGPDSNNVVVSHNSNSLTVTNNNNVNVGNATWQSASTGSARVSDNTTGGDATSGDASNTSSTSIVVNVKN